MIHINIGERLAVISSLCRWTGHFVQTLSNLLTLSNFCHCAAIFSILQKFLNAELKAFATYQTHHCQVVIVNSITSFQSLSGKCLNH